MAEVRVKFYRGGCFNYVTGLVCCYLLNVVCEDLTPVLIQSRLVASLVVATPCTCSAGLSKTATQYNVT